MRHAFIAQTHRDALRLAQAVDAEGWHARITRAGRHTAVIIHAPAAVVAVATRRARFSPGVSP
jgi:hypothetical protein